LQLPPGANSGVVVGGAATPSPSAQPAFDWLLPEGRRKLPGPRYTKERTIRKTLFGKVVLFWDHQSQQRVAIKLSNKNLLREGRTTSGNIVSESPLDELKFLRMLSRKNEADGAAAAQPQHVHPGQNHVLQLLDECEDANDLWTVLECQSTAKQPTNTAPHVCMPRADTERNAGADARSMFLFCVMWFFFQSVARANVSFPPVCFRLALLYIFPWLRLMLTLFSCAPVCLSSLRHRVRRESLR